MTSDNLCFNVNIDMPRTKGHFIEKKQIWTKIKNKN